MGKKNKGVPDRWLDYLPIGLVITGTKIVTFKVPLKTNLCQQHLPEDEWFTPALLLERQPKIKTVIDLTNTFRYYNGEEEFGTKGIDHVKILVEGRGTIPTVSQLQKFFDAMDQHMEKYKDNTDALIGVHCTHGLNRTGYFVCRWMVERMTIRPDDAIERFNLARGHTIERQHLLNDLRRKNLSSVPRSIPILPSPSETIGYRSPLDDFSYDEPPRDSRYSRYRGRDRDNRGNSHYRDTYRKPEGPSENRRQGNLYGDSRRNASGSGISDSYRGDKDVSDRGRIDKERYISKKRDLSRVKGRADLDKNWRARDQEADKAGAGKAGRGKARAERIFKKSGERVVKEGEDREMTRMEKVL